MRTFIIAFAMVLAVLPISARAQDPVVVELYTSQGCSSCPPADRLLAELAHHDYVIALALHVDYWDYLGWKDDFADPDFSDRQRRYARVWHERSVYTPQMVIQGVQYMVGSRADEVQRQIMQFETDVSPVLIEASFEGDTATVTVRPENRPMPTSTVYLVRYSEGRDVMIERGENRGKTIHYVNVVEAWDTIAEWDGRSAISIQARGQAAGNYVVIVQEAGQGQIFAARLLSN